MRSTNLHAVELVSAEHELTNSGALGALTAVPIHGEAVFGKNLLILQGGFVHGMDRS